MLYNEYLKCGKKLGVKNDKCLQVFKWANSICPSDLIISYYEARRDDKWYHSKHDTPATHTRTRTHTYSHTDTHGREADIQPTTNRFLSFCCSVCCAGCGYRYGYEFPLQEEELKDGDEITVREKPGHGHGDGHH